MTHNTIDYEQIIRESGHRVTPQRRQVLDAVCECAGHATFDEIYRWIQAHAPGIDQSTVYRNLDFLSHVGLIISCEINGEHVYEIAAGTPPHHHLVCRVCGAEVNVDAAELTPALQQIAARHGFTVDTNHLILYGLCASCHPSMDCPD